MNPLQGLGAFAMSSIGRQAAKYLPEPATNGIGMFRDIIQGVTGFGADVGGVPDVASGDFADLIHLQIDTQRELQSTTMISNIERSKHESKMSAIRNIRVA